MRRPLQPGQSKLPAARHPSRQSGQRSGPCLLFLALHATVARQVGTTRTRMPVPRYVPIQRQPMQCC